MAGEMPATVPFVGPKKRNDVSPRGKEDDNPDTGGTGWSVTGRSRRHERPNTGAQDVVKAHEAKQNTAHTPTMASPGPVYKDHTIHKLLNSQLFLVLFTGHTLTMA